MKTIWTIKRYEREPLAPYAQLAKYSKGRVHPERSHALRTEFQRDKDRIVHSQAFRRLEYKTQVFVTGNCDHFRTRLTHTIEVAGITRTIVRSLGLNEDLAETIALAHDIGHPPFGHSGEKALDELLVEHGGFDHNYQALVVVDELEEKYPNYAGLNLSWEVRAGLMKHRNSSTCLDGVPLPQQLGLEAQAADIADDLTYMAHDMDDGILSGILDPEDMRQLRIWQLAESHWGDDHGIPRDDERYVPFIVRNCIDMMVANVIENSLMLINSNSIEKPEDAENFPTPIICFPKELAEASYELKNYLFENLYWNPTVLESNETAVDWMRQLFHYFLENPQDLGRRSQRRIESVGLHRAVGDYIAMMTDRYAFEQYQQFIK